MDQCYLCNNEACLPCDGCDREYCYDHSSGGEELTWSKQCKHCETWYHFCEEHCRTNWESWQGCDCNSGYDSGDSDSDSRNNISGTDVEIIDDDSDIEEEVECSSCERWVDFTCDNCRYCDSCCDCEKCGECGATGGEICSNCGESCRNCAEMADDGYCKSCSDGLYHGGRDNAGPQDNWNNW